MSHPLPGLSQRLRPDMVTEQDRHELYQANAPQVAAGLYLVPKVIDEARVSDWHTSTLTQLPRAAARKFSSVELVRAYLDRIDASQAALNAFISVTREQALADAAAADRHSPPAPAAPTGVPIAHKDIFCTQVSAPPAVHACSITSSRPTTPPWWRDSRGRRDHAGKTNMDEFAMGSSSETSFYGPCAIPGTRSSCPAAPRRLRAAVAARLVPAATATDTAARSASRGSVRITGLNPPTARVALRHDRVRLESRPGRRAHGQRRRRRAHAA